VRSYTQGEARLPTVHQQLSERGEFLAEIRKRLELAQQRYKSYYDHYHRDMEFAVGQWVWLRLQHRPVASIPVQTRDKQGLDSFVHSKFWRAGALSVRVPTAIAS
jgi:hypothetical protein